MEQSLSVGTVNVQTMSRGTKTASNPNDVQFKVEYSAEFKGKKNMPEGIVTISKESAEQFAKAGIGHVVEVTAEPVKEESAEQVTSADDEASNSDEKEGVGSKSKSSKSKDKK